MPRRILAVVSITCGSILYTLDGNIANVALPFLSEALGIAETSAVLLVSVYNLTLAMVLLPLAAVGERLGHKRVFTAGLWLYIAASLACFFARSLPVLLVLRATQALGGAALLSVSLAMVRMAYPARMLGRGLGLNTMAASLGAAVAPPLGGFLLTVAPWQGVFLAGVPLALIGLATCANLPRTDLHSGRYDTRGAVLCALTFGMVIAGLQALGEGAPPWLAGSGLAIGLVAAVAFVRHETRVARPVLPVDLLARPRLALSVGAAFLAVLASMVLLLYLPFRLHEDGISSATIGAMMAPYALAIMIAAPTSGMLSDRISPDLLGIAGTTIAALGLASFAWLPAAPPFLAVSWRMVVCAVGFSMFFSPNGRMVVGSVERERAAGSSSLLATTRMFGQALGAAGFAGVLALDMPQSGPFLLAAGLAGLALACNIARALVHSRAGAAAGR